MPVYLYKHTDMIKNGHSEEFEVEQSIHDKPLETCPHCNEPVKRLIAGGVFVTWKGGAPTSKNYAG